MSLAIAMDFWVFNQWLEEADQIPSAGCYTQTFCKITHSFVKLGPWATLIGHPMLKGLSIFSNNRNLVSGFTKILGEDCDKIFLEQICSRSPFQ